MAVTRTMKVLVAVVPDDALPVTVNVVTPTGAEPLAVTVVVTAQLIAEQLGVAGEKVICAFEGVNCTDALWVPPDVSVSGTETVAEVPCLRVISPPPTVKVIAFEGHEITLDGKANTVGELAWKTPPTLAATRYV